MPVDAAGFRAAVGAVVSGVQAHRTRHRVRAPAVSPTSHDVLIQFAMTGSAETAAARVQPVLDAVHRVRLAHPDVTIEQFGDASANKWFNDTVLKDFKRAEWTAVPLALGILLIVFGSLLAASLPVVLALTAFFAANGLLAIVSHAMHVDTSASSVMLLMGLAVGVDYCLFYLRREREERAAGHDCARSLEIAAATSGRSVLVSGLTVIVAMAGMFLSGMQLFAGFAIATISVVFIAMIGSVTVLPALMSMLGDKVELGRVPFLRRRRPAADGGRIWNAVLPRVLARPADLGDARRRVAARARHARAQPAHRDAGHREDPACHRRRSSAPTTTSRRHSAAVRHRPLVVVTAPDAASPQAKQAIASFEQAARRSGQIGEPIQVTVHPEVNIVEIQAPLAGSGSDARSRHALRTLHDTIVPSDPGHASRAPGHWSAATSPRRWTSRTSCGAASCRSSCSSWASRSC